MSEEQQEGMAVAQVIEAEVISFEDAGSLQAPDRVAVDTAKAHPRSLDKFKKDLYTLVTMDVASARGMFYSLKRGKKPIQGPSVRFAECALYAFGNLRVYGRVVDIGSTQLVAEAMAWDLEQNTQIGKRVTRRITDRQGNRYSEDMIAVTANAAISIAVRNVVLGGIPRPLWWGAYEESVKTSAGDAKTIKSRRKEEVAWWKEQGGTEEDLWAYLDIKGPEDIGGFQFVRLTGLKNAIEERMTTFQREIDLLHGGDIPEDEAAALDAKIMEVTDDE